MKLSFNILLIRPDGSVLKENFHCQHFYYGPHDPRNDDDDLVLKKQLTEAVYHNLYGMIQMGEVNKITIEPAEDNESSFEMPEKKVSYNVRCPNCGPMDSFENGGFCPVCEAELLISVRDS